MNSPDRDFVVDAAHLRPHGWLRLASFPDWQISREVGYTVGFFMFWAVTALSSFTTVVLLEPARQKIRSPHA